MVRGFFFILFMLASFQLAAAETIYVDIQKGDDKNPGSYEKPLLSIQKAIDIANSLNKAGVSKDNALTYSIIYSGYISGVWLNQTDEDFTFHHNVISNCQYSFMRSETNINTYHIKDSIINNYKYFSGKCIPEIKLCESGADMPYQEKNIVKTGFIQLEKGPGLDQDVPHRYLHILQKTQGSEIGAGLFMN
ncbi:MAG: hypothetical protein PVG39_27485 [Desulfobacteraceae bacterium]|jgi:hypothetical protein